MATMKRRVIYMSDAEWATLTEEAQRIGRTVSSIIRETLNSDLGYSPEAVRESEEGRPAKARHEIERFNTRPFTPVPKRGK